MRAFIIICFLGTSYLFGQGIPKNTPELNKKILAFVEASIGKKIGRGECWDLAQKPLDKFDADWNGLLKYGKVVNPKKVDIFPGDIIQFERVIVKYEQDGYKMTEQFAHHTAIVYRVDAKGSYQIAQQNTSFTGRKVGVSALRLEDIKKGKITFYRPIAK